MDIKKARRENRSRYVRCSAPPRLRLHLPRCLFAVYFATLAATVALGAEANRVSVMDFCSGQEVATDITACAQKAIDAAGSTNPSYGGRKVHFPAQNSPYLLRGRLTLAKSFVGIEGDGPQASFISCANGAEDCVIIGSADIKTRGQSIENIGINGDGKKSKGANVRIVGTYNVRVERVQLENCIRCVDIGPSTNGTTLRDITALVNQEDSDYGIYWHASGDGTTRNDVLTLDNVLVDGRYSSATGVMWEGFSHTLVGNHLRILHMKIGMRISNPARSDRFFPSFMNIFDLEMEGFTNQALAIEAGANFKIIGSDINNNAPRSSIHAGENAVISISSDKSASLTRGIQISDSRIGNGGSNGIFSDARDVKLSNVLFASNNRDGSKGTSVVRLGPNTTDAQIVGMRAEAYGGTARADYAIQIDKGAERVQIVGLNAAFVRIGAISDNTDSLANNFIGIMEPDGNNWSRMPLIRTKGPTRGGPPISEGSCGWDSSDHKLKCFDGVKWRSAW